MTRRIMNGPGSGRLIMNPVMRKPDSVKNNAMPNAPAALLLSGTSALSGNQ